MPGGGWRLAARYLSVWHDAVVVPVWGYAHGDLALAGEPAGTADHLDAVGDEELIDVLSSNLCRCTGYQNIIKAVRAAAAEMRGTK